MSKQDKKDGNCARLRTKFVPLWSKSGSMPPCGLEACCYAFNGLRSCGTHRLSACPLLPLCETIGVTMRRYSHLQGMLGSTKGFTLVEMMIVTAIIGILSSIAVPNYIQWQARYQLKQAAMEVTSQLSTSRFVAMTRNVAITTAFAISGGQLVTVATDPSGTQIFQQATTVPKVSTVAVQGGGNLQFSSSGLRASGALGSDQLVQVTNNQGLVYSVRLTQGGKASWCPRDTCP